MWLFVLFIAIPLIEIGLFIQVGGLIGLWPTLAIVIVTAVLGTSLMRAQGAMAMGQIRDNFNQLRDPTESLAHGAMILFAGALLLTPGFFTDAVGFSLLIPGVRHAAYRSIRARVNVQTFGTPGQGPGPRHPSDRRGPADDVIDGEYYEIPENQNKDSGPSGWTKH